MKGSGRPRKGINGGPERQKDGARMARQIRIEYAGATYDVMAPEPGPGNLWSRIANFGWRRRGGEKTGWRVNACVMMGNRYPQLIATPEANLVSGMKWFQWGYTQR